MEVCKSWRKDVWVECMDHGWEIWKERDRECEDASISVCVGSRDDQDGSARGVVPSERM